MSGIEKCDCLMGLAEISDSLWSDEEDFRTRLIGKSVMDPPNPIYVQEWIKQFNFCPMCGRKLVSATAESEGKYERP